MNQIFEIKNGGFVNKGAHLMLLAVLQRIRDRYPGALFAMTPTATAHYDNYLKRGKLGILQKASFRRHGIPIDRLAGLLPKKLRRMYGLVLDSELSAVFDISGFHYSDQWGDKPLLDLLHATRRRQRLGVRTILLPQAFGPFHSTKAQALAKSALGNCDLVYARDLISYQYLTELLPNAKHIRLSPDFTPVLDPIPPAAGEDFAGCVAIVPNARMIDKVSSESRDLYVPFLIRCIKLLQEQGLEVFLLVHEGPKDYELARAVSRHVGDVRIITEDDPLRAKGILGSCYATISSRFHALVSALSCGTPSLASGWSHKYEMLMKDYGLDDWTVSPSLEMETLAERVRRLVDAGENRGARITLRSSSMRIATLIDKMWSEVFNVLETSR